MSEEILKEETWWKKALTFWPLALAVVATSVFGWYTVKLAQEVTTVEGVTASRYLHFLDGRPNEMGDTLAGFVGSLTLIRVIASVLQQSMELRAQRKEFSEMVRAQDAQVNALEAQARIFEDERKTRDEIKAGEVFEELLQKLRLEMKELSDLGVAWQYDGRDSSEVDGAPKERKLQFFWPFGAFSHNESIEENYFLLASKSLLDPRVDDRFVIQERGKLPQNTFARPPVILQMVATFGDLESVFDRLSEKDKIRFKRFKLDEMFAQIRSIMADDSLWSKEAA